LDESSSQEQTNAATFVFEPRRCASFAWKWVRQHVAEFLCALFLTVMFFNMLPVIAQKSITNDEVVMIPAAYYHLVSGDFQVVNEHPPLSKILAGLPLLFIQPNETRTSDLPENMSSSERTWDIQEHFWRTNRQSVGAISFWARVPAIGLTLALGVLLFAVARDLFGARAAVFSLGLFTLEPTVLAHGRVVQTDIPAALGYLLVFFMLRRHWTSLNWQNAVLLGLAAGLAMLAKFSMLIASPILAVYFLALLIVAVRRGLNRAKVCLHAGLALLMLLVIVNAAYFFQSRELTEADVNYIAQAYPSSSTTVLSIIRVLSWLVPTDFVFGVFWQLSHSVQGHSASLLGMFSQTGWWYYFPVAFALKTSLPFLMLALAAIGWGVYRAIARRDRQTLFILVPFAVYTAFVMTSRINIGVRYYLPAFMFIFILAGAMLDKLASPRRLHLARLAVVIAMLGWCAIETVRAYPHYMTYMNQLASGAPHWYYLSDSNVEWGDDVRELADYLRARGETRVRAALLGGFVTLNWYGVEYIDALASPTESSSTRYVAIGASFLNGSTVPLRSAGDRWQTNQERIDTFDAFRHQTPEAIFGGGSIYLYRRRE
jgi:4-amino-4-deoxy-L-arabinose transferase-like glycosyltransferase